MIYANCLPRWKCKWKEKQNQMRYFKKEVHKLTQNSSEKFQQMWCNQVTKSKNLQIDMKGVLHLLPQISMFCAVSQK